MNALTQQQRNVVAGMAAGAIASALYFAVGFFLWPAPAVAAPAITVFGYACAIAGLPLVGGVMAIAAARFFDPARIDGHDVEAETAFNIDRHYLQNTTEQLLLFVCAQAGLAAALEPGAKHLALLYALWFVAARAVFWVGYRINPTARSFGFAATFYPTIGVYLGLAIWIAFRGFQFVSG